MSADQYAWMTSALCAQSDPSLWTDGLPGNSNRTALRICGHCPVRDECDQHRAQLETHDGARIPGIWGGRSQKQRRNDRQQLGEAA